MDEKDSKAAEASETSKQWLSVGLDAIVGLVIGLAGAIFYSMTRIATIAELAAIVFLYLVATITVRTVLRWGWKKIHGEEW